MKKISAIAFLLVLFQSVSAFAAWTEWEEYCDATFEPHYWYKQPQTGLKVDRREDTANPDRVQFRINGMFGDSEGNAPVDLIINAHFGVHAPTADDVAIWIDDTFVESFDVYGEEKSIYLCDAQTYYETFFPNNPEYALEYESSSYFRQETGTFHIYSYYHYDDGNVPFLDAFYQDQAQGPETIKLHRPEFKNYTPEFGGSSFSEADGTHYYNLDVKLNDLSAIKMTVCEGTPSSIRSIAEGMNNGTLDCVTLAEDGSAALPFSGKKGTYTMVYLTYKAAGATYQMGSQTLSYDPDWKTLGTGTFTDGFISKFLEADIKNNVGAVLKEEDYTYAVEIQESQSQPGLYRVLNPYGSTSPYWNLNFTNVRLDKTAVHYLTIDATDPERVFISDSECGFYYGAYPIVHFTQAYDYLADGFSADAVPAELWGKLKDGVISFDAGSEDCGLLCVKILTSPAELYGRALVVTLPGAASAELVSADGQEDGAIEYYNLQGLKIKEPVRGQLLIVKQGGSVKKVLYK